MLYTSTPLSLTHTHAFSHGAPSLVIIECAIVIHTRVENFIVKKIFVQLEVLLDVGIVLESWLSGSGGGELCSCSDASSSSLLTMANARRK